MEVVLGWFAVELYNHFTVELVEKMICNLLYRSFFKSIFRFPVSRCIYVSNVDRLKEYVLNIATFGMCM